MPFYPSPFRGYTVPFPEVSLHRRNSKWQRGNSSHVSFPLPPPPLSVTAFLSLGRTCHVIRGIKCHIICITEPVQPLGMFHGGKILNVFFLTTHWIHFRWIQKKVRKQKSEIMVVGLGMKRKEHGPKSTRTPRKEQITWLKVDCLSHYTRYVQAPVTMSVFATEILRVTPAGGSLGKHFFPTMNTNLSPFHFFSIVPYSGPLVSKSIYSAIIPSPQRALL